MRRFISIVIIFFITSGLHAQTALTTDVAVRLSKLPLHCICNEFPNKTSHLADGEADARLLPRELHPVFYGCLDWHSSVHGHWMLVKLLKQFPQLKNRDSIIAMLDNSFQLDKMQQEAVYFGKYTASVSYERTYGWAWLLKLDEELLTWNNATGRRWHEALQPLTQRILQLWKAYLPKQTYPSRIGMHGNTAFALGFASDWAKAAGDIPFAHMIDQKAKYFYLHDKAIPAQLEPDGADFFSPSLQTAYLMSKVLSKTAYLKWLGTYFTPKGIQRLCQEPTVSDRNDYQTVHLDGLYFSRAWCMRGIAGILPAGHQYKQLFTTTAQKFLNKSLPQIFNGGYGGEHWLASFAVYALSVK